MPIQNERTKKPKNHIQWMALKAAKHGNRAFFAFPSILLDGTRTSTKPGLHSASEGAGPMAILGTATGVSAGDISPDSAYAALPPRPAL